MTLILGEQLVTESLEDACHWYSNLLESKFNESWTSLLRPCLEGLDEFSSGPRSGDLAIIYKFMRVVAETLMNKEEMALVDVVDALDNRQLLKSNDPSEEDGEHENSEGREIPNQLAFAAMGWLSKFTLFLQGQD